MTTGSCGVGFEMTLVANEAFVAEAQTIFKINIGTRQHRFVP
jgi:hypothetical protein